MVATTFVNARLPDLAHGALSAPTTLTVADGRIVGQGLPVSERAQIVDLKGLSLMPGLIDCHFHVVAWSRDLWANAIAPDSLSALRAASVVEDLPSGGFTTVRDLGGADLGLVRAIQDGLIRGPNLVICGKGLSMTGGHTGLRQRSDIPPDALSWSVGNCGVLVDAVDDVRRACRKMLKEGARFIKVMANGGVALPNDPIDGLQYSDDEIRAMVEEARNANTYVSAHVYSDATIRRCVQLGVKSLEHCNLISPETAEIAAEAGCIAIPTLAAYEGLKLEGVALGLGASGQTKIDIVRDRGRRSLFAMREAGLPMAFGTDLLGPLRKYSGLEFELLAQVLAPAEILRGMWESGATLCRMEGQIGTLAPGARAHLVAFDADPFADITALGRPKETLRFVIKDGVLCDDLRQA